MKWNPDLRIADARPAEQFTVIIDWNDGSRTLFDASPHMHGVFFGELNDPVYFSKLRMASHGESIEWPNGQDFSPEMLYEESRLVARGDTHVPTANGAASEAPAMLALEARKDGTVVIDWSDGSRRLFDAWAHAGSFIDALSDASYVTQAKIASSGEDVAWPNGEAFSAAEVFAKSVALQSGAAAL